MDVFALITIVAMMLFGCHGYGYGPPETACTDMFPVGHHVNASTSAAPFEILVNATSYQAGDVIEKFIANTVSNPYQIYGACAVRKTTGFPVKTTGIFYIQLNSKTDTLQPDGRTWFYEGVLIQVRSRDCQNGRAWGQFTVKPDEDFLQPIECFNTERSTIRHFNHAHIYNRTFYWTAPATPVGHVFVRATVARNRALFWMDVFSPIIADTTDSANSASIQPCAPRMDYRPFCETSSAMNVIPPTTIVFAIVLALAGSK